MRLPQSVSLVILIIICLQTACLAQINDTCYIDADNVWLLSTDNADSVLGIQETIKPYSITSGILPGDTSETIWVLDIQLRPPSCSPAFNAASKSFHFEYRNPTKAEFEHGITYSGPPRSSISAWICCDIPVERPGSIETPPALFCSGIVLPVLKSYARK